MKRTTVVVSWSEGLKLRPAARLIRVARRFRSSITLRCGENVGDVHSIMSVVMLCATMGTAVNIEASGEDEELAILAVTKVFSVGDDEPE